MLANRMLMCMNKRKIDRSVPVTVVASAYTTSAAARPQVLSNGWLISCAFDSVKYTDYFYVSKDNGKTWSQLCSIVYSATYNTIPASMCSYGTKITIAKIAQGSLFVWNIDSITQSNVEIFNIGRILIDSQPNVNYLTGSPSIAVSSTGCYTLAWSTKTSSYPNSFNIRSVKSIDGGVTWTKQDGTVGIDQITSYNYNNLNYTNPCVIYKSNNLPTIVWQRVNQYSTPYDCAIYGSNYNGTTWAGFYNIYTVENVNYAQSNPTATVQKYGANAGRIWVAWQGKDSDTNSNMNIRLVYSDDNGVTWSSVIKINNSNTQSSMYPTLCTNNIGDVYIVWAGSNISYAYIPNGSLTPQIFIATSNFYYYPSSCDNYYDFLLPIMIFGGSTQVAFSGVFNV